MDDEVYNISKGSIVFIICGIVKSLSFVGH